MQLDPAQVPLPPSPTQDRVFAPISPFSVRGPGEGEGRVSPVWEPPRKRARLQEHELELGPGQGTRTSLRRARTFDCSPTTGRLQPIQRQQPLQPPVHQDPQHQQEEQDTQQQPLQGPCMPALGMTESLPIWEDLL
ncbi:hypothetical protein CALCODRAFT_491817 [Calocera cornea HHB12733]|uniref:Uncharacterized protein n=1 Tax=Calocera cornea HHB12733 TaxID=1353952 RepID=A0A165IRK9_9BASI|nr:hypothetical protein CALCODRAFT_491817 [Calocera cornea HHB12733]